MNLNIITASIWGNLSLLASTNFQPCVIFHQSRYILCAWCKLCYAGISLSEYFHRSWHNICNSQLKLPQQVALTEFKGQVSAMVEVIIVTKVKRWVFPRINSYLLLYAMCPPPACRNDMKDRARAPYIGNVLGRCSSFIGTWHIVHHHITLHVQHLHVISTDKTTPKGSTYEFKDHQCLH